MSEHLSVTSNIVEVGSGSGVSPTPSEYIVHHLKHFAVPDQASMIDFSVIHVDTMFFSLLCGLSLIWFLYAAAKRATTGVPGRFQALVELLVEFVENQSKSVVHGDRRFIAPLALTIFVWIVFMNSLDLLPLDLLPKAWEYLAPSFGIEASHAYMRVVPTADLNATLGMSTAVLLLILYYSVKIKGFGGFVHELFCAPFGSKVFLWPFNFLLNLIEFAAKAVSLGMRLFGNMYAGELVFMIIALLGSAAAFTSTGVLAFIGHVVAGSAWAIFHILIVLLQAFIFMMLTLIYLGQAHESH